MQRRILTLLLTVLLAAAMVAPPGDQQLSAAAPPPDVTTSDTTTSDTGCPFCGSDRELRVATPPLSGADVGELQDRLAVLGYYEGPFDWIYSEGLATAVRALQRRLGLAETGVVTASLWASLGGQDEEESAVTVPATPPNGEARIVIDTEKCLLYLYFDDTLYAKFPVAVGKSESPTPVGDWHIKDKRRNWGQGFGSRFMLLDVPWGVYGIHGTNKPYSIGSHASHGCIRMFDSNVQKLYNLVKVGTPVRITGQRSRRRLCRGDRGPDVMEVQAMLAEAGYFEGAIDGFFGKLTEQAVLKFQNDLKLTPHGQIDSATYNALGL